MRMVKYQVRVWVSCKRIERNAFLNKPFKHILTSQNSALVSHSNAVFRCLVPNRATHHILGIKKIPFAKYLKHIFHRFLKDFTNSKKEAIIIYRLPKGFTKNTKETSKKEAMTDRRQISDSHQISFLTLGEFKQIN